MATRIKFLVKWTDNFGTERFYGAFQTRKKAELAGIVVMGRRRKENPDLTWGIYFDYGWQGWESGRDEPVEKITIHGLRSMQDY